MKIITRETMSDEINKIKSIYGEDVKFYSISRLNNFNSCKRAYYYTYINKKEQDNNIYSLLGSGVHSDLEKYYEGETDTLERKSFDEEWMKSKLFGIKFMSENVENNYKKDIDEFYKHYKKRENECISEMGFILKLDDKKYMTGYIDLIEKIDDDKVKVIDFKTSSRFDKKKIVDAGRQLCIYQMALEQLYNLEVVENAWEMIKYITVQIGSNKPKIVSSREWVSKSKTQLKTLLKKEGIESIMIDAMLAKCEAVNNIDILPENVRNQVSLSTYVCKYDITQEVKDECMEYILNTIKNIENTDVENIDEWECNVNEFYCKNLCAFSKKHCKQWKKR